MASRQSAETVHIALLDAARDLIAEIGYSEMSHADIAAIVGIGRTTFYEHFSSKEDVLVELGMDGDVHIAIDRGADDGAGLVAVEARQVGPAAGEADAEGRARDDHRVPVRSRIQSAAARLWA